MSPTPGGAFATALSRTAMALPAKAAVVDDTSRLTYAELETLVDGVASELRRQGVGPGDVVTSQLSNCIAAVALCLAANRVGAVHNPVVTIYRDHEIDFIRGRAATALWVGESTDPIFTSQAASTSPIADPPDAEGATSDDARFLLYTSGSTAEPKGVLHTDATLAAECEAQAAFHALDSREVFVIPSPVGHISGLLYGILLPIWLGATTVLLGRWDPAWFLERVESEGGTFSGGAPPFLAGVADHPDLDRFDTSTFRVFPCGGADVSPELISRATKRLGVRTGRGYGSTEFPSITSSAGLHDEPDDRAQTDGRPIGTNEVRIVDGEIQARGPELFVGYRDPSHDVDAFTEDGWFRTGDLGTIDDRGYLTVTGRRKDVIIRSGENISAREVEELIDQHGAVAAVAVIARPDPKTGERVTACVVPTDPHQPPSLADLCRFLDDLGLSTRKLPEQLELLDALPMLASGKVDKQALRADRG